MNRNNAEKLCTGYTGEIARNLLGSGVQTNVCVETVLAISAGTVTVKGRITKNSEAKDVFALNAATFEKATMPLGVGNFILATEAYYALDFTCADATVNATYLY